MLFLVRVVSFLKHYWFIPLIALTALAFFVARALWPRSRVGEIIDLGRVLSDARDAHRKEVEASRRAQSMRDEANNRAIKRMQDAEAQVRAELERNLRTLDVQQEKRVKQILKQLKDDPHALANELERETGIRVIVVD